MSLVTVLRPLAALTLVASLLVAAPPRVDAQVASACDPVNHEVSNGGFWLDPFSWSNNQIPGPGDIACIAQGIVSLDGIAPNVAGLLLSPDTRLELQPPFGDPATSLVVTGQGQNLGEIAFLNPTGNDDLQLQLPLFVNDGNIIFQGAPLPPDPILFQVQNLIHRRGLIGVETGVEMFFQQFQLNPSDPALPPDLVVTPDGVLDLSSIPGPVTLANVGGLVEIQGHLPLPPDFFLDNQLGGQLLLPDPGTVVGPSSVQIDNAGFVQIGHPGALDLGQVPTGGGGFFQLDGGRTEFVLPDPLPPAPEPMILLPAGDFHVDSFFDITYRIDFQDAPGPGPREDLLVQLPGPPAQSPPPALPFPGNVQDTDATRQPTLRLEETTAPLGVYVQTPQPPFNDVTVLKGIIDETVSPAGLRRVTFELTAGNEATGPSAVPVTPVIKDDIDGHPQMSYVSDTLPGGYDLANWTPGQLDPGVFVSGELVVDIIAPGPIENCAQATDYDDLDADSDPGDTAPPPVEDDESCVILPEVDIEVEKALVEPENLLTDEDPDREVEFLVTVRNAAPPATIADDVEVTDLLPAGFAHLSNTPSEGSYDPVSGVWDGLVLDPGEEQTLTIVAMPVPGETAIDNCAAATLYTGLWDFDSNPNPLPGPPPAEDDEACVTPMTDVEVVIDGVTDVTTTGAQRLRVDATVTNALPANRIAEDVHVDLEWLTGMSLVPGTVVVSQGTTTPAGATIEWDAEELDPGQSETIEFVLEVDASDNDANRVCAFATQHFVEEWEADSSPGDLDVSLLPAVLEDDEDCRELRQDLEVRKRVLDTRDEDGVPVVRYEITASNASDATIPVRNIVIEDVTTGGGEVVTPVTTPGGTTYDEAADEWTIPVLGIGGNVDLVLEVRYPTADGPVENCANAIAYDDVDADSSPGTIEEDEDSCVTVENDLDVSVVVTQDTETSPGTREVTYRLTATNTGASVNVPVRAVDVATDIGGTTTGSTPSVGTYVGGIWNIPFLAVSGSATLDVVVEHEDTGPHEFCLSASAYHDFDLDSDPDDLPLVPAEDDEACLTLDEIDVSLAQTVVAGPGDDEVRVTVDLTNDGPANVDATGVVVDTALATGLFDLLEVRNDQGTLAADGTWTVGDVPAGTTLRLVFDALLGNAGAGDNCVGVNGYQSGLDLDSDAADHPPYTDDDEDCDTVPEIDVEVSKSLVDDVVVLGERELTWTVTVTNDAGVANVDAEAVVVNDLLPVGLSHVSNTPSQGTYDPGSGDWTVGALAPGASATLSLTASQDALGPQTNCAVATDYQQGGSFTENDVDSEPDNGLGEDDSACRTTDEIDIELSKAFDPGDGTPTAGDRQAEIVLTVTNDDGRANVTATGVEVTDVLDGSWTYVSQSGDGSYDDATGVWDVGDLAVGESKSVTVVVDVDGQGPHVNCAEATAYSDAQDGDSTPGDGQGDDHACATLPEIDLEITQTIDPHPTDSEMARITIDVTNAAPPAGVPASEVELAIDPVNLAGATVVSKSAGTGALLVDGWVVGDVPAGETRSVTYDVDVTDSDASQCVQAVQYNDALDADSDADNLDVSSEDDDDCDDVAEIDVEVGVIISASGGDEIVDGVRHTTFSISGRQDGTRANTTAEDVLLSIPIPAGMSFVSSSSSKPAYDETTEEWPLGTIGQSENWTLSLVLAHDVPGPHTLCAEAVDYAHAGTTGENDQDSDPDDGVGDDVDCATTSEIDIAIDTTLSATEPRRDRTSYLSVTASNDDPRVNTIAQGVLVDVPIPAGTTFVDDGGARYDETTGEWDVVNLLVGQSKTLVIELLVDGAGPIEACAEATQYADELDTDSSPDNDVLAEDDQFCDPLEEHDLELTKTVARDGDTATFTLTVSNTADPAFGAAAEDVVVEDVLPDGLVHVSDDATLGFYDEVAGEWRLDGALQPGASATLELVTTVTTEDLTENCAEVAFDGPGDLDPDSSPDNGADEDDRDCAAVNTIDLSLDLELGDDELEGGDTTRATVTLANAAGRRTAFGVAVSMTADGQLARSGARATPSVGTYDPATGVWTVPQLASGATATLDLEVTADEVDDDTTATVCAAVTAATGDDPDSTPGAITTTTGANEDDEACSTVGVTAPDPVDPGPGVVDRVEGTPDDDTPTVGELLRILFRLLDADDRPLSDVRVLFFLSGANDGGVRRTLGTRVGEDTADDNGEVTHAYTGTSVGVDTVTAVADVNGNGIADDGEPRTSVTVTWQGSDDVQRLAGETREGTAVAVSQAAFGDDAASAVVLARSDAFPDGLAGTPFAHSVRAPLLLTAPSALSDATSAEIDRVLPDGATIHVLGGPAAVSDGVTAGLTARGYVVDRIAGDDRFATAVAIADRLGDVDTVFVATGRVFADALAAGPAAIATNGAIVLSDAMAPNGATTAYLGAHPDADVWAVGGPAATAYPTADPIVGTAREDTAVRVAEQFFVDPPVVGLARSDAFPDALAGGVHVGRLGGPILLTAPTVLQDRPRGYLAANATSISRVLAYGGTVALAESVTDAANAAIRSDAGTRRRH